MTRKIERIKDEYIQLRDAQLQQFERAKKESDLSIQEEAITKFTEPLGKLAKGLREAGIDPSTLQ